MKTTKLFSLLFIAVLCFSATSIFLPNNTVKATNSTTTTFNVIYDTVLQSDYYSSFSECHDVAQAAIISSTMNWMTVGEYSSSSYSMTRSLVYFNTSTLPSNAIITSATIAIHSVSDVVNSPVIVMLQSADTGDNPTVSSFNKNLYSSNFGTVSVTGVGDYTFSLNSNGLVAIAVDGVTRFGLRTQNDVNNIDAGRDTAQFASSESGNGAVLTVTYSLPEYTITASNDTHSTILPSGTTSVVYGNSQTYTISALTGYEVTDVLVDSVSIGIVSSYTFSNVQANHTISVTSAISNYTIYASSDSHSNISPSGTSTFSYGASQNYTISANSGYTIQAVYVDGANIGVVSYYYFSSISADHTIYVSTSVSTTYSINATSDSHSSILPSGIITVALGGSQTFAISPNSGYYINHVLVDNVNVGAVTTYTFTNVIANHNISVVSSSGSLNITGPYYDGSGSVAPTEINATVYYSNGLSETKLFNGTSGTATTYAFNSTTIPSYITWQMASSSNYSRTLNFRNLETSAAYNLSIPNPSSPAGIYSFQVVSFTQITNAYLATSLNGQLIEQISLNSTGSPSFIMQQYLTYTVTLYCDQGTITRTFLAQTSYTETFTVSANDFPSSTTNGATANATRSTSTSLLTIYTDPEGLTSWVYIKISHLSGTTIITDYTDNQTTSSYSNTLTISATTDYSVTLIAYKNGTAQTWLFTCPATPTGTNLFEGLLDFLFGGVDLPFDVAQLIPAFIILLFLSIGSFRSAGFSCFAAWVVTCIFAYMGWWTATIPSLAFAGFLSIIIAINEAKETTREV